MSDETAVIKVRDLSHGRLDYGPSGKKFVYGADTDETGLGATVAAAVSIDRPEVRDVYDEACERYDPDDFADGDVVARVSLCDGSPEVSWVVEE